MPAGGKQRASRTFVAVLVTLATAYGILLAVVVDSPDAEIIYQVD